MGTKIIARVLIIDKETNEVMYGNFLSNQHFIDSLIQTINKKYPDTILVSKENKIIKGRKGNEIFFEFNLKNFTENKFVYNLFHARLF